jgi:hypothetical protein
MGFDGVRCIINRWREDQDLNAKIIAYVLDRDGKRRDLLEKLWPGKQELFDSNHVIKSFDRKLNNNPMLNGIKQKLRRWFTFLLHMNVSTQQKTAHWRNTILHYQGIRHGCLSHPAIKGPPWGMVRVRSISAPVQSIDDSQDGTNSAHPESPQKRGRPLKPVPTPSATSGSCPLSRGRPQKAPTKAPKRGRAARSHHAGGERDERPDSKAGRTKSHTADEVIPEKVEALGRIIDDARELLDKAVPEISTQICEIFLYGKFKLAPKYFD